LYYSYLYEVQHVSGDTPPIIRSLKLHWHPLVFHTWKVVGREVGGRCQAHGACRRSLRWLNHRSNRQPQTYVKPEAAITVFELLMMRGVLLETCLAIKKYWNNKFYTRSHLLDFFYDIYLQII